MHVSLLKSEQDVDPIIKQDMMPELLSFARQPIERSPTISDNAYHILAFIRETQAERFEMLYEALSNGTFAFSGEDLSSQQRSAAVGAITSLARVTDHICAWHEMHSLFRALCTWPGDLSDEFVQLLTQCDSSALAIYTHWLMLVALAEDLWWLGDMGRMGIRAVVELIPKTDVRLHRLTERPRDLLDLIASTP